MRVSLKCQLKDCAYCQPTKHVYKYDRHRSELSEARLLNWWDRVKDKPVDFLFAIDQQEDVTHE